MKAGIYLLYGLIIGLTMHSSNGMDRVAVAPSESDQVSQEITGLKTSIAQSYRKIQEIDADLDWALRQKFAHDFEYTLAEVMDAGLFKVSYSEEAIIISSCATGRRYELRNSISSALRYVPQILHLSGNFFRKQLKDWMVDACVWSKKHEVDVRQWDNEQILKEFRAFRVRSAELGIKKAELMQKIDQCEEMLVQRDLYFAPFRRAYYRTRYREEYHDRLLAKCGLPKKIIDLIGGAYFDCRLSFINPISPSLVDSPLGIFSRQYRMVELFSVDKGKALLLLLDIGHWIKTYRELIKGIAHKAEAEEDYNFEKELIRLYEDHRENDCFLIQGQKDAKIDKAILQSIGYNLNFNEGNKRNVEFTSSGTVNVAVFFALLLYVDSARAWSKELDSYRIKYLMEYIKYCYSEDINILDLVKIAHERGTKAILWGLLDFCMNNDDRAFDALADHIPWYMFPEIAKTPERASQMLRLLSVKCERILHGKPGLTLEKLLNESERKDLDSCLTFFAHTILEALMRKREGTEEIARYTLQGPFSNLLSEKLRKLLSRYVFIRDIHQIVSKISAPRVLHHASLVAPDILCAMGAEYDWKKDGAGFLSCRLKSDDEHNVSMYAEVLSRTAETDYMLFLGQQPYAVAQSAGNRSIQVYKIEAHDIPSGFTRRRLWEIRHDEELNFANSAHACYEQVDPQTGEKKQRLVLSFRNGDLPTRTALPKMQGWHVEIRDAAMGTLVHELDRVEQQGLISTIFAIEATDEYILVGVSSFVENRAERIKIWNSQSFQLLREIALPQGVSGPIKKLQGDYIAVGEKNLYIYNVKTGEQIATLSNNDNEGITALLPINNNYLMVGVASLFNIDYKYAAVRLWDLSKKIVLKTIHRRSFNQDPDFSFDIAPLLIKEVGDDIIIVYKNGHVEKINKARLMQEEDAEATTRSLEELFKENGINKDELKG